MLQNLRQSLGTVGLQRYLTWGVNLCYLTHILYILVKTAESLDLAELQRYGKKKFKNVEKMYDKNLELSKIIITFVKN